MAAPKIIEELIDKFDHDLDFYRSGQYNETELINPFNLSKEALLHA